MQALVQVGLLDIVKEKINAQDEYAMQMPIDLSVRKLDRGGGPFVTVFVRKKTGVATGYQVTPQLAPTAHAKVLAIRLPLDRRLSPP